jgi:hypothetical protein
LILLIARRRIVVDPNCAVVVSEFEQAQPAIAAPRAHLEICEQLVDIPAARRGRRRFSQAVVKDVPIERQNKVFGLTDKFLPDYETPQIRRRPEIWHR